MTRRSLHIGGSGAYGASRTARPIPVFALAAAAEPELFLVFVVFQHLAGRPLTVKGTNTGFLLHHSSAAP